MQTMKNQAITMQIWKIISIEKSEKYFNDLIKNMIQSEIIMTVGTL